MTVNLLSNSLQTLYSDKGFLSMEQKKWFCEEVVNILNNDDSIEENLNYCLHQVWMSYDMGGHSIGRSERSILLESTRKFLTSNNPMQARKCLGLLLSMYHNIDYVRRRNWMDSTIPPIESPLDLNTRELFPLVLAGFILDIDELPDINSFSPEDMTQFANNLRYGNIEKPPL